MCILKLVGIRCDTVAKDDVYYLVFYDIDIKQLTNEQYMKIREIMTVHNLSYILYRTKNGYHIVGLTPVNKIHHASAFSALKGYFKQYYGGIVIRIIQKPDEKQELILLNETNGEVIPNLFNLFADRFGLQKKPWRKESSKYLLVFVRYRTDKT